MEESKKSRKSYHERVWEKEIVDKDMTWEKIIEGKSRIKTAFEEIRSVGEGNVLLRLRDTCYEKYKHMSELNSDQLWAILQLPENKDLKEVYDSAIDNKACSSTIWGFRVPSICINEYMLQRNRYNCIKDLGMIGKLILDQPTALKTNSTNY